MKIENPYHSTSSLPTYTHIYWQDDEIHVSLLSLLLKKKMKTTGHHFATNTSPTLLSTHTHTKPPRTDKQTDSQGHVVCCYKHCSARSGVFGDHSQPVLSLFTLRYLGTEVTPEISPKRFCRRPTIWKKEKKRQMQPNQAADDSPDLTTPNQQQGNRKKKKEKRKANMGKGCPHLQQACRVCTFPTSLRVHVGRKTSKFWWWQGDE